MTSFSFDAFDNSYTIGATEKSLTTGSTYSSSSVQTTQCDLVIYLDTSSMAAGDQGTLRVYEKIRTSGSPVVKWTQAINYGEVVPPITIEALGNGWDVTMTRTAGADFALPFSLRKKVYVLNDYTAQGVWDYASANATVSGSMGESVLADSGGGATAAEVWDYLQENATVEGSMGARVLLTSTFNKDTETVVVGTNNDKTGYQINGAITTLDALDTLQDAQHAATQARLPAALVGGRMDASVGAMAANTLTASALATDAVTEIQSGLATSSNVSSSQSAIQADIAALNDISSADVANAVWNAATGDYTTPETLGGEINDLMLDVIEIKAKTDQLAFTSGNVNANTKAMNDAAVLGNGTEANLWRGA